MTDAFRPPYPGYDVLDKWHSPSWNDQTREVMIDRATPPEPVFFGAGEYRTLQALCDRVVPQPERAAPIPVAPWIDAACAAGRGSGTRYADMPEGGTAWRRGLSALDAEAQARHGAGFADIADGARDAILRAVDAGDLAAPAAWGDMPAQRFLRHTALKQIVQVYYVHPAAMSEIGYGGPAAPRGYVRLGADRADPWEAPPGDWSDRAGDAS